jgi:hypothetical protein
MYSSQMNQGRDGSRALTAKYLQRSLHHGVTELNRAITKWAKLWNENPKPFIWTKSADEIFASMQKYLGPIVPQQTSDGGHYDVHGIAHGINLRETEVPALSHRH